MKKSLYLFFCCWFFSLFLLQVLYLKSWFWGIFDFVFFFVYSFLLFNNRP